MIQKTLRLSAIAAASFFAFTAAHAAGATGNIDANIEQDNTYQDDKVAGTSVTKGLTQGGRVEVNFSGKATSGDAFVAAKGTAILQKAGGASTDDMWVQFGTSAGDLKLGRFEATDLWPQGRDTIVNRAGTVYNSNWLRGRFGNAAATTGGANGNGIFAAEGTVNLAPGMALIIGAAETKQATDLPGAAPQAAKGIRPIFSFSTGGIGIKVGGEFGKAANNKSATGIGATAAIALAGGNLNVNLANGKVKDTVKATTIGANYTMDLGPWAFLEYGQTKPDGGGDKTKVTTLGLGYQLSLLGVKNAFVTPALGYSEAKTGSAKNKNTDVRVRFNYGFDAF